MKEKICVVYGLRERGSSAIRYIGQTHYPLRERVRRHLAEARRNSETPKSRWIRKLIARGGEVEAVVLAENVARDVVERQWIAAARYVGWALLNATAGGDGLDARRPTSDETRANMRAAQAKLREDPEFVARHHAALVAAARSVEGRALRGEISRRAWADEATRARRLELLREAKRRPELIARHSAATKVQMADPAARALIGDKARERLKDPANRERIAAGLRAYWADPETRAARAANTKARKANA